MEAKLCSDSVATVVSELMISVVSSPEPISNSVELSSPDSVVDEESVIFSSFSVACYQVQCTDWMSR